MTTDSIIILPTDPDYLDQLVTLQRAAYNVSPQDYDHPELLQATDFANHLRVFPEGQFMALDPLSDQVVGSCTSMIIAHDITQPITATWAETTAYGSLHPHNPQGDWLYGVDNVVLKAYRGKGIGGRLMQARYRVAQRYNLRGMIAGSMPIDYHHAAAEGVDIQTYIADVIAGRRWDTNLSKQLKKGCRVLNVIPNYLTDSHRTHNYGVAIVWDNPTYRRPAARIKQTRPARGTATQPRHNTP